MKRIVVLAALALAFLPLHAQTAAQKYVEQLKTTDELKEAVWGVRAVTLGGRVIADWQSGTRMMPASDMKLLTTGLAINELGSAYKVTTGIAYSGTIDNGVLKGDIYIVGGGDPTIGMQDNAAKELQPLMSQWAGFVRSAGIRRIEGRVIGDGRYLDCEPVNQAWQLEDAACGDGAPMSGLSFGGNLQAFNVSPGARAGSPVKIEAVWPECPWMNWSHTAVTSPAGTGQELYYNCTGLAPLASMTGTLPLGTGQQRLTTANCFGELTCAYYFYKYLENQGIAVTDGPADISPLGMLRSFDPDEPEKPAASQNTLKTLGRTESPTLVAIATEANHRSDNFYAEAILRLLSKELTGSACIDSCQIARSRAFAHLGVKAASHSQFNDGSGLSRKNYVTPALFTEFLAAMGSSKQWEAFLSTIPAAGSGTLSARLAKLSDADRARVRMKSGSFNGTRCFSGYILPSEGKQGETIVFSIMTNNTIVASSKINFIMDKLIGLIAEEN